MVCFLLDCRHVLEKGNVPLKLQKVILETLVARNIIGLQFKLLVRIFLFLKFLRLI